LNGLVGRASRPGQLDFCGEESITASAWTLVMRRSTRARHGENDSAAADLTRSIVTASAS